MSQMEVCAECGSTEIQVAYWVNLRTMQLKDSCENSTVWCPTCNEHRHTETREVDDALFAPAPVEPASEPPYATFGARPLPLEYALPPSLGPVTPDYIVASASLDGGHEGSAGWLFFMKRAASVTEREQLRGLGFRYCGGGKWFKRDAS